MTAKNGQRAEEATARERLLAAAGELFYREGIRSVGIDEVIAAADVAKMSLYRSFASKDELVAAYLRERDTRYWEWWDSVVARHPNAPREQLLALFRYLAKLPSRPGGAAARSRTPRPNFPSPTTRRAALRRRTSASCGAGSGIWRARLGHAMPNRLPISSFCCSKVFTPVPRLSAGRIPRRGRSRRPKRCSPLSSIKA